MIPSPKDAVAALRDIEEAQARSATLHDYHRAAPHLMIWGVLWALAFSLTNFFPTRATTIWVAVIGIGIVAGLVAVRNEDWSVRRRHGAAIAAIFVFCAAAALVMWPVSGRQLAAFIALVVALMYVLRGIWSGPRYIGAGIGVAALTLLGFFLLKDYFLLWMAAVGGGSLMLAGAWLRRV